MRLFSSVAFVLFSLFSSSAVLRGDVAPVDLVVRAEAGDVAAMRELAEFYGKIESPNERLMFSWTLRAAQHGCVEAQSMVGFFLIEGFGAPANPTAALHWLELAATQGDLDSQLLLGTLFLRGSKGVPRDLERSFEFFMQAAKAGSSQGQLMLAICYEQGLGCTPSLVDAKIWAERAAEQDDPRALAMMGVWVRQSVLRGTLPLKNKSQSQQALEKKADEAACPYFLAAALLGGAQGLYESALAAQRDVEDSPFEDEAFRELFFAAIERAAQQGFLPAVYEYASCFESGYGVEMDQEYAAELMRDVAAQGYKPARMQVLRMAAIGQGRSISLSDEYLWLLSAT